MVLTGRLLRRIERDYPEPDSAAQVAGLVSRNADTERVAAAIVLWGAGDQRRLKDAVDLARLDWRDLLVGVGLADEGWRTVMDQELGSEE